MRQIALLITLAVIGDRKVSSVKSGDVQFVPTDVTHPLKNVGKQDFELIAIAVK
jgi:oxalate decarboxylase/phosphoglucose isomerase-like protein (cupin superfamily)